MKNGLDFLEYGRALANSLFADRVLLALARFQRLQNIGGDDAGALRDAIEFLSSILSAERVLDTYSATKSDIARAKVFDEAVNSASISLTSKTDFVNYVQELKKTAETLLSQTKSSEQAVEKLVSFFTNYGTSQYQRSEIACQSPSI